MADFLKAGDKVPFSGIYQAIHARHHADTHYVTVLFGDRFPSCLQCLEEVRFELNLSAVHVHAHRHFNRDR
jgi:hypothetical protein